MARNVVLALSTLAVLTVLFVGYTLFMGSHAGTPESQRTQQLPKQPDPNAVSMQVGPAKLPGGGRISYTKYDEHTGRPTDVFSCDDWTPVTASKNEFRVTKPELVMLLPSGMVATITADVGQLTMDRGERSQARPKQGQLSGNVQILIDRETHIDRTAQAERPDDLITITVDKLQFDLEQGELRTADRVAVVSEDFEIAGTGLYLLWNQANNRVESLTIDHGEEFAFYTGAGLFGAVEATSEPNEPNAEPAIKVVDAKAQATTRKARERRTAYDCRLVGDVVAEQYRADQKVGGLTADEIHLLFDIGSRAGRLLRTDRATSRPARDRSNRLALRWTGKLQLGPAPVAPDAEARRLHFEARGKPVVLTRGDGSVRCGRVEFHEETQRIWLDPLPGEQVEFAMGRNLSASAAGVYVDRAARLVKLAGAVDLRSRHGDAARGRTSRIRAAYWAELHMGEVTATSRPASEAVLEFGQLEAATFVGDVGVELEEQTLVSNQLNVTFRGGGSEQSLEESLDTATATGNVQLLGKTGTLDAGHLELRFAHAPERAIYPQRMHATGSVVLARDRARIRGDEITAELELPPERQANGPDFVLRTLEVTGRADLRDPKNKVAARGTQIVAEFVEMNRLVRARVSGTPEQPGHVHAEPYTVRGEKIELDRDAQTLHVDGRSRLAFKTQRSLQGQERGTPTTVAITSTKLLHVDGRKNTVRFEGDVNAVSAEERLQGDTLTLLLEDAAEPAPTAPRGPSLRQVLAVQGLGWLFVGDVVRDAQALAKGKDPRQARQADELGLAGDTERLRKEPVRLVANNGLITSESYEAGETTPSVHASISAPLIEMDIRARQIVATGLTQLLMTDRRGAGGSEPAEQALGLPSALITRGPSQTAMQCRKRMVYTLGADGPDRRDAVVFEDEVVFVHRAGKDMVNLQEMLPQLADNPALLETLKSRKVTLDCQRLECWFAADSGTKAAQRGGGLTRMPLQLASLLATDGVYLRDQQGPQIREVNAARVEFDRPAGRVEVRGTDTTDARIYTEDTARQRSDTPHVGKRLIINLKDGTITSGEMKGEWRRP